MITALEELYHSKQWICEVTFHDLLSMLQNC